ncbi:ubiquitin conjugating enzyme e2 [Cystoisospora suis]|uniref:Ubiquitin conjugating enzyme e2 n=1 Tax=Cystoisospora suis TaxID=483139 RepID=A0A2C6KP80_9APIC|nr:ubiquitin conjugating enzyme e2 [Cystoisospora suis]
MRRSFGGCEFVKRSEGDSHTMVGAATCVHPRCGRLVPSAQQGSCGGNRPRERERVVCSCSRVDVCPGSVAGSPISSERLPVYSTALSFLFRRSTADLSTPHTRSAREDSHSQLSSLPSSVSKPAPRSKYGSSVDRMRRPMFTKATVMSRFYSLCIFPVLLWLFGACPAHDSLPVSAISIHPATKTTLQHTFPSFPQLAVIHFRRPSIPGIQPYSHARVTRFTPLGDAEHRRILFSHPNTPLTSRTTISRAVAASICLPRFLLPSAVHGSVMFLRPAFSPFQRDPVRLGASVCVRLLDSLASSGLNSLSRPRSCFRCSFFSSPAKHLQHASVPQGAVGGPGVLAAVLPFQGESRAEAGHCKSPSSPSPPASSSPALCASVSSHSSVPVPCHALQPEPSSTSSDVASFTPHEHNAHSFPDRLPYPGGKEASDLDTSVRKPSSSCTHGGGNAREMAIRDVDARVLSFAVDSAAPRQAVGASSESPKEREEGTDLEAGASDRSTGREPRNIPQTNTYPPQGEEKKIAENMHAPSSSGGFSAVPESAGSPRAHRGAAEKQREVVSDGHSVMSTEREDDSSLQQHKASGVPTGISHTARKKEKIRDGRGTAQEAAALRHLQRRFSPGHASFRIQRELRSFLSSPPPNCRVYVHPSNIRIWLIEITGVEGSPYANETYRMKVVIPPDYPFKPPTCFFLHPTPVHPHVYSNGDICLNLLGSDWRPSLSISSIAVAVLSMLTNAKQKQLPLDNASHLDVPAGQRDTQFLYHDDKV